MSKISNSDTIRELIKGANLQTGFDNIPNDLARSIVPTLEINPEQYRKSTIVRKGTASNATSATAYTTPTDRDFYLCGCSLSVCKDVTSTSTNSDIEVYPFGETAVNILTVAGLTLTADAGTSNLVLPFPLKLARGSTIKVLNTTNVANVRAIGSIVGYIDEMSRS